MANDNFLAKEHSLIDYYKAESVRDFEHNITNIFNDKVKKVENEIAHLKNLVAIYEAIFLN
jgi:hypothetical protein